MDNLGKSYHFLNGGGEMGELTRGYDWSKSIIGAPGNWPQCLRITVSLLLSSKFPMFLWWGENLIQFYNDAYRPSLGNDGKHPLALGQKGDDCWPEIWDVIHPLIDQVRSTGEAIWFEDQLVPIFRNGKIEDVYWTFSYSPVRGETDDVEGVLVVCTETTEKVLAMQRLEESERRYRILIEEGITATALYTGPDIRIEYANDTMLRYWGKDRSIIGMTFRQALPELEGQPFPELLEAVFATGTAYVGKEEKAYLEINGKLQPGYYNYTYKALRKDDGTIYGIYHAAIEVTEQVIAREKAEESEQQLREVVENAPFPIAVYTGREMRVSLANQSIMDIWGKGNDVVGKLFTEVLPELGNQEVFDQILQVYTTGQSFHTRSHRLDLIVNGKVRPYWFNYSFTPLFDSAGNVYGVMNTGVDNTDLILAKLKVEENEKNIRNTILKAPVAMCILRGPEYVVEIANERMIEVWGRTSEDLMNKPIFEGLPEARDQGFEQLLHGVYTTGNTFSAQGIPINLPRSGKLAPLFVNVVYEAFREVEGTISGIIAVVIDVTDQVLARQKIEEVVAERTKELAEVNSTLKRSNEELAQFAYIASHDLQEPVRKVSTFAQMLEQSLGEMDERPRKYLDKISTAASRMGILIRDVLAYSQLSKEREIYKPLDLQQTVQSIIDDFELLIEQKQATIEFNGLPQIKAIPLQMSQLFGNLISNSLKFSKADVKPHVNIKARILSPEEISTHGTLSKETTYYDIEIRDNGIGFKQEHADQIFNIFQRLHGKSEYAGTGIGLAMCKKIAQNHHGIIYATGSSEEGAVINVILPAAPPYALS
jgi:signal transduction histidine kinase